MLSEKVKGFRDILPPESLRRREIIKRVEENFRLFGFMPVETPTVEYEEIAAGEGSSDEAVSDRFRLKDRGGRKLMLRYEFTFQLKRLFKENPNIKLPFRKYQIGQVFRDEPTTKDRYREFIQMDADIIGDSSINADVECLALAERICRELKIDYELVINNRKLYNSILDSVKVLDKKIVSRELDKIGKIKESELKNNLKKHLKEQQVKELFNLFKKDIDFFIKNDFGGASELKELIELLKAHSIKPRFSPNLIRGFSYYTGNVFEAYNPEIKGSLFSGGRYDDLVGKYINKNIPAVGISFGRIVDIKGASPEITSAVVLSINQEKRAMELTGILRNSNISCMLMHNKPSKALEYANSYKIPFVVFLGEDEVRLKKFKLKNMMNSDEELIGIEELKKRLSNQK